MGAWESSDGKRRIKSSPLSRASVRKSECMDEFSGMRLEAARVPKKASREKAIASESAPECVWTRANLPG